MCVCMRVRVYACRRSQQEEKKREESREERKCQHVDFIIEILSASESLSFFSLLFWGDNLTSHTPYSERDRIPIRGGYG